MQEAEIKFISPKKNKQEIHKKNTNYYDFSFKNAIPCKETSELLFKQYISSNKKIMLTMISYLEINEIINLKNSCRLSKGIMNKNLIKDYIKTAGLTDVTRINFWFHNLPIEKIQEETKKQLEISLGTPCSNKLYWRILELANEELSLNNIKNSKYKHSELNPANKGLNNMNDLLTDNGNNNKNIETGNRIIKSHFRIVCDEIGRDLHRTFHSGIFSDDAGQKKLGNVLISLAFIRPEINYCQGMNFVAGALLEFFDEELAFWIFLVFLDYYEMNSLYAKVKIFLFQIKKTTYEILI